MQPNNPIQRLITLLASLYITVAGLLILMVLVIWGTLYQVDHGIFAAQERFFRAWIVMIGGVIPFPAVNSVIALLSVNLVAAAFRKRPLTIRNAGIIICHIGVAALIGGSVVSSFFVQESAISLSRGQSTETTYDFSSWRLVVNRQGSHNGTPYRTSSHYPIKRLGAGKQINLAPAAARLSIRNVHRNCGALMSPTDSTTIVGLKPLKPATEEGRSFPGVVYTLTTSDDKRFADAPDLFAYAGSPLPASYSLGDDTITVSLEPLSMELPLRIQLIQFTPEWHPGTTKARRYESRLRVFGKNIDREVTIEMNRPFRHGPFTFYQMGYTEQDGGGYASTLAIVKNPLRYMPYISSLIVVAGLFLHFFVKMWHELASTRTVRRADKR